MGVNVKTLPPVSSLSLPLPPSSLPHFLPLSHFLSDNASPGRNRVNSFFKNKLSIRFVARGIGVWIEMFIYNSEINTY